MKEYQFYDAVPGKRNVQREIKWIKDDFDTQIRLFRKGRPDLYFIYVKRRKKHGPRR